jgi:hypothetical protein
MKAHNAFLLLLVGIPIAAIPMFPQGPGQAKPSFEVATVKPNGSGENRVMFQGQPGGRFVASNVTLKMLIGNAYRLPTGALSPSVLRWISN